MSELPVTKPDFDKFHWNDGGTPNPRLEPNEAKKDDGFIYCDVPPYQEENWWRWYAAQIAAYLGGVTPRLFTTLAEGIAACSFPDRFVVVPSTSAILDVLSQQYSSQGVVGAYAVKCVRTDGQRIYYAQQNTVVGANPEDPTDADWVKVPGPAGNITDLWADGDHVYVLFPYTAGDGSTEHEIYLLDPATGNEAHALDLASPDCTAIRANGEWMVVVQGQKLLVYQTTPTYIGQYDHGDTLAAAALSNVKSTGETLCFIGGARGTSDMDLRAIKMSDCLALWSVALPTDAEPTINCIVADGERVYVGVDAAQIDGVWACILVFSELDGTFLFACPGGTYNCIGLAVDDRYVYASSETALDLYMYDKRTGERIGVVTTSNVMVGDVDGLGVFGTDGANNVTRRYRGQASQMFIRVEGDDPNRQPFHKLAIPA